MVVFEVRHSVYALIQDQDIAGGFGGHWVRGTRWGGVSLGMSIERPRGWGALQQAAMDLKGTQGEPWPVIRSPDIQVWWQL